MSINLTKKTEQKQEKNKKNWKGFNQAQRQRDATEGIETKQIWATSSDWIRLLDTVCM